MNAWNYWYSCIHYHNKKSNSNIRQSVFCGRSRSYSPFFTIKMKNNATINNFRGVPHRPRRDYNVLPSIKKSQRRDARPIGHVRAGSRGCHNRLYVAICNYKCIETPVLLKTSWFLHWPPLEKYHHDCRNVFARLL